MKKLILLIASLVIVSAIICGCYDEVIEENPVEANSGMSRLKVTLFDAPAPEGIEHLYLNIVEVAVHNEDEGWMTLSGVDTTIDFLELVNGVSVVIADDSIPSGYYSQLRLILADNNEIIVKDASYPLTVPSGLQTGVKLNFDLILENQEFVNLYVDFDVSKSVLSAGGNFKLKPTYQVFMEDISAKISGTVTDAGNNPLENIVVEANGIAYSTSTITDDLGAYMLILPAGIYDIKTDLASPAVADTSYTDVILMAGDSLTGYDFVIE